MEILLKTDRLLIRPIRPEDNLDVFNYRSDKETNKHQGFVPTRLSEVDAFIAKNPGEFNTPETWFQLVLSESSAGAIIGDIGVHFIDSGGFQCELGCTLGKDYQGKGYATEAMNAVIAYLFGTLRKHRIIGSVDPRNLPSIHLLERLRFRKEAHFKESILIDGEWVDDIVYAMLRSDWAKLKN
ncbi:MAG: GNAT family protein [Bacteroidota bacterium]